MTDWKVTIAKLLATLTPREEKVIRLLDGLGDGIPRNHAETATIFRTSTDKIREVEVVAREKLTIAISKLSEDVRDEVTRAILEASASVAEVTEIRKAVASFNKLTPGLIEHIKSNYDDIDDLQWPVVEHLVAELLAQQGFEDVRLVGRNFETGADVYACKQIASVDLKIRFYIEVKHVKQTIGIDSVRLLYGAMTDERPEFGWDKGILVTSGRIAKFRKGSRESWELKGVAVKDREDLYKWLSEYSPNEDGLWLPKPRTDVPRGMTDCSG